MRHYANFRRAIEEKFSEGPAGREIAELFGKKFSATGFDVRGVDSFRDFAWSVELMVEGHKISCVFGPYADANQWMASVTYSTSFLSRLRRGLPTEQRKTVTRALHKMLTDDPEVDDIEWVNEGGAGNPAPTPNG